MDTETKILDAMRDAELKAWEALSGYKFWMFGYHAGRWVNYNRLLAAPRPNPFQDAVKLGRAKIDGFQEQPLQNLFTEQPLSGEAGRIQPERP